MAARKSLVLQPVSDSLNGTITTCPLGTVCVYVYTSKKERERGGGGVKSAGICWRICNINTPTDPLLPVCISARL